MCSIQERGERQGVFALLTTEGATARETLRYTYSLTVSTLESGTAVPTDGESRQNTSFADVWREISQVRRQIGRIQHC